MPNKRPSVKNEKRYEGLKKRACRRSAGCPVQVDGTYRCANQLTVRPDALRIG
jgi:hypothetical protein